MKNLALHFRTLLKIIICLLFTLHSSSQTFTLSDTKGFKDRKINLFEDNKNNKLILYKTSLRLNTDGAPKSYHPKDLKADSLAFNLIMNAVSIYRKKDSFCISIPNKDKADYTLKYRNCKKKPSDFSKVEKKQMVQTAYKLFEQFIEDNYEKQPNDYEIFWNSVLVEKDGKPCIFSIGENKGYYASKTAVNNGNTIDKGDCDCNFYLDATKIPAMVLPKGKNALSNFGAKKEDLIIAYNPKTKIIVYAIIGDTGPSDNLGEGNILMNWILNNKPNYPTNRQGVNNALVINNDIIISIIPNSANLIQKPYSEEKIKASCEVWLKSVGFESEEKYIEFITKN